MDNKILVSIGLFILVEAGAAIWWASGITTEVQAQEVRITEVQKKMTAAAERERESSETIIRIDERVASMQQLLAEIAKDIKRQNN